MNMNIQFYIHSPAEIEDAHAFTLDYLQAFYKTDPLIN